VPAVLAESSAYYLLGVEPPAPSSDGRFHAVQVRVNRANVDVRTRKGYYDETREERTAAAKSLATGGAAGSAIARAMPASDVPLELVAAPFAVGDKQAALALALSIGPRAGAPPLTMPHTETVELVSSLFNPETGDNFGAQQQRLTLTWTRPDQRFNVYEVLSRLPAARGRYELRVGVRTWSGAVASVYTSVEVPDFDAELSTSGLVLRATPAPASAPADAMGNLLSFKPTSRRTFRKTDQAVAFMRIYQGKPAFAPTTVSTRLVDARNAVIADITQPVAGATTGSRSAGDYEVELPLASLSPGEYLLTVAVAGNDKTLERQLRFRVE
jgi:hypothetical protein